MFAGQISRARTAATATAPAGISAFKEYFGVAPAVYK